MTGGARSDRGTDFRGQLGRFRLDPAVSSTLPASIPRYPSQSSAGHAQFLPPDAGLAQTPSIISTTTLPNASSTTSHSPESASATTAVSTSGDRHTFKTKRVSTACEFCRKRKKKCDFQYPNCSACTRAGVICTVQTLGQPVAHHAVPRDQIENLQKRVEWLEQILRTKTGLDVADRPTGSVIDDDEDTPDTWYHVPNLMAQPRAGIGLVERDDPSSGVRSSDGATLPLLDGESLPNIGEIFRDKLENRPHSVARPGPSVLPVIRRLGSWKEAERLANQYFEGIGMQYPFLHRVEFMRDLRRIYQDQPVAPEVQNSYHVTFATAMLTGPSDGSQATAFYAASRDTLPPTLQNEDLVSLQALLSLALYALSSPSGPSMWQVLGTAMRLATSLGFHKARPSTTTMTKKDLVEDEMTKRAFWSLYNLDRLTAVTLNRPLGIADEDVTVDLPREYDEHWVEAPGRCQMSISVQVMKLRRIFSQVYRCLYSHSPRPNTDVKAIISEFHTELDSWRVHAPLIPSSLLYSTSYYDYLYHSALVLMYRPSMLNPTPDRTCIIGCRDSSALVIQSYWDNYSVGKVKWIWLTLCNIYSSGVTILWCIEQNVRALRQGLPALWDNSDTTTFIDAVLVLLDEFAKRRKGADRLVSQFQRQSSQVLDRMAQASMEQTTNRVMAATAFDPNFMDQVFYTYNWLGEEVASFYAL